MPGLRRPRAVAPLRGMGWVAAWLQSRSCNCSFREVVTPLATARRRFLRGFALDQGAQAAIVLMACGTALEMGAHARDRRFGVLSAQLELDITVELLEAFLAADFGT